MGVMRVQLAMQVGTINPFIVLGVCAKAQAPLNYSLSGLIANAWLSGPYAQATSLTGYA